jgi:hypothetical protein
MNPRHAAALALLIGYFMVPPTHGWNLGWFLTLPSGKTILEFSSEKECKQFVDLAHTNTAQSSIWNDVAEGQCVVEDDRLAPSSQLKGD